MAARAKVYISIPSLCLVLLFYSIRQSAPIIVEPTALLGLGSYLPATYWIGLALLLSCSVFAFIDTEFRNEAVFLYILLTLGVFLFGIGVLVQENPASPAVYYPSAVVYRVLAAGSIDISAPHDLLSYLDWPAIHFLSAALLETTAMKFDFLLRYATLFWMLCFVLVTFSVGKRLGFKANVSFLLSFLALSAFGIVGHFNYTPQGIALVLYFFLIMFWLGRTGPRAEVPEAVMLFLVFAALTLTHGFTSVVALAGLVVVSAYRRRFATLALLVVILFVWYVYQAFAAMEAVPSLWARPFTALQLERYIVPATPERLVHRYAMYYYLAAYGIAVIASVALLLRGKLDGQVGKRVLSLLYWLIPITLLLGFLYGHETPLRLYYYAIVPAVIITSLAIRSRKGLIGLMVLSIVFFVPARYGDIAGYGQVSTAELRGAEFFADRVKPNEPYFYNYDRALILFYDTSLETLLHYTPMYLPWEEGPSWMDKAGYVVLGKQGHDALTYSARGEDPYDLWPQTQKGREAAIVYSSGHFQIYANMR